MRVGNGSKVDVIAVGTLPLYLPSGLVLDLDNCYLVPALSMNIISGSCLLRDDYSFKSENNGCSIYMSNIFYGHAPISEKCVFIGHPKETIGYTFYHRSEDKIFVAKNGSFLEKEFLSKEISGRKVELDEVLPLEPVSGAAQENVPKVPAPTREEVDDDDHETSDQVATELHRSKGHVPHQSGMATLSWKSCC